MNEFLKILQTIRLVRRAIRLFVANPMTLVGTRDSAMTDFRKILKAQTLICTKLREITQSGFIDRWQYEIVTQQLNDNKLLIEIARVDRKLQIEKAFSN